ncbi:MAG: hypothetical protein OWU84_09875 [Firmicutes bacterium]|nr:hypothetical protein [Bacillota bacterium]
MNGRSQEYLTLTVVEGERPEAPEDIAQWIGDVERHQGEARQLAYAVVRKTVGESLEEWTLTLTNRGPARPLRFGVRWRFWADAPPCWLVPGMFYKTNRPEESTRLYPRFAARPTPADDPFTAAAWAFRGDRLPVPAVFAQQADGRWYGLSTAAEGPHGQRGVAFGYDAADHRAYIGLNLPYEEAPLAYTTGVREPAYEADWLVLSRDEQVTWVFYRFVGPRAPHGYDPFVRYLYRQYSAASPLNPWMSVEEAADLTAYGLYRWHYAPADRALYETVAFDREGYDGDRRHMHVGWVSGAPWAYALLQHGLRVENRAYCDAAREVLDHITEGMAPAGILYGEWTQESGFQPGWTGSSGAVHTRTLGEAVWFLLRAWDRDRACGMTHPQWEAVVRAHLDFLAEIERNGNLGTYYDPLQRGRVLRWDGTGGLIWIPALVAASRIFGEQHWLDLAQRAGRYYAASVIEGDLYGAPEDVDRSPSSEDGYNAVIAYVHLYEATQDPDWLELARMSAQWTLTFRWTHNLSFSPHTILGAYDFRTRGADLASPANNHLHSYGLLALPEFLRLSDYTRDHYFRERTRDNLFCFLQFIARADGDFNALRGMVGERYYQTDWAQPKGKILALSHAWCAGVMLYAAESLIQAGERLES